jgi:sulfonate transport system permease protein
MVPLFILWFGIGEKSKVLVIALGTLWPILLNTENGIRGTDMKLLEVAKILKKNKFSVLCQIILPSMIPALVTGVRLGLSNAWRGVVSAEMLGASRGIGYMISYAREMSRPALMFVGLLIIGIVGILIDILLFRFQQKLVRWV